jgi:hypothetical protein
MMDENVQDEHDKLLDKVGEALDGHDLNDVMPVLAFLITRCAVDSGNGKQHFLKYMNKIADTLFDKTPINLQ